MGNLFIVGHSSDILYKSVSGLMFDGPLPFPFHSFIYIGPKS